MIYENLKRIEESILIKCAETGRNRDNITLIAVSKTYPVETIKEAFSLGLRHFGENKAQELKQKNPLAPKEIDWHFIGHLQTNKVKDIIQYTSLIHSVDSIKLAEEINKRAGNLNKIQKILLEIKSTDEYSKFGITDKNDLEKLAFFCSDASNLELSGLMTMAPYTNDKIIIRKSFSYLRSLFDDLNLEGYKLTELSMGMTNDFEIALEEGATMLRIGSAIFGHR